MAHSPLLRTIMRVKLDSRSIALVNYELALEGICSILPEPPNKENFNQTRWDDLRKDHENKKTREARQKSYEHGYMKLLLGRDKPAESHKNRLFKMWERIVPAKSSALKLAVAKSGFGEWKPPLLSDCLLFEQDLSGSPVYGRVWVGETGILDRRLLHRAISPKYVPKPHFKMERKRLEAKSAEFAEFSAKNRALMPRPQDESSDEGLLSVNETPYLFPGKSKRDKAVLGKRKRAAAGKAKGRTRKPAKFIKLYDCKAHDRPHLKAQGINRFSLMQQRVPRIEYPPLELVKRNTSHSDSQLPIAMDVDDDGSEELSINGIVLPVRLPGSETATEEQEQQTPEEISQLYRLWRTKARLFFDERDRYMQSRVYHERAHDRDLLRAVQALISFWAKFFTAAQSVRRV
ncbi:hypothetical protein AAE478_001023 [Parahypoxylon ruwenzoriense]